MSVILSQLHTAFANHAKRHGKLPLKWTLSPTRYASCKRALRFFLGPILPDPIRVFGVPIYKAAARKRT